MASHNADVLCPAQCNSACRHSQHAQARALMHIVNNLPENPGRIYPISSFVAAAVGERRYGSTSSHLPCLYRPKCFHAASSPPQFPPTSLGLYLLQLAPLLAFYPSFVLGALLTQSAAQSAPARRITLLEVISWGALLPHPPLQRTGTASPEEVR